MPHIVTDACIRCKYGDCMKVCPVDCFRGGPNMVVIDPELCIDCTKCVPECPVDAIYPQEELPSEMEGFVALNAELSQVWDVVTEYEGPLPEAKQWKKAREKLQYLER
jgi:ferredoxin